MRFFLAAILLSGLGSGLFAQSASLQNVTCTFRDGKEISMRYQRVAISKDDMKIGKPYVPGGSPILLFTQTPLLAAGSEIPAGAFSIYVIPETDKKWVLAINKNISAGSRYDQAQDLVRLPMDVGNVGGQGTLAVVLVHIAPTQCNVRIYHGKQLASWAGFQEK